MMQYDLVKIYASCRERANKQTNVTITVVVAVERRRIHISRTVQNRKQSQPLAYF